jgi:hypothetical protein
MLPSPRDYQNAQLQEAKATLEVPSSPTLRVTMESVKLYHYRESVLIENGCAAVIELQKMVFKFARSRTITSLSWHFSYEVGTIVKSRIMYIERKDDGVTGPARIGRVTFSKSGKSLYYQGRRFETLGGSGFKANYFEVKSGQEYWISGCKRDGSDRLYGGTVEIDPDVAEEYWTEIRKMPQHKDQLVVRSRGKYGH